MNSKRGNKASALERWAELVNEDELVEIDSDELRAIAQFAARRDRLESALAEAVRTARRNGRTWSQIGTMLGVTKQAAQRKYARLAS
jgi:hypothetical protein